MPRHFSRRAAVMAVFLLAESACSSSTDSAPNDAGGDEVASEEEAPSCATADVPTGSCGAGARCSHSSSTCGPGVRMVCNTRWICTCASGEWECAIAPGSGLGCVPCPGYEEADASADAEPRDGSADAS